ncbi:MAG: GGDEF domain-containing protein [Deltaproteobacteria bacterium]|nr:MAG: GGDEF domain-containing protein [Deltaproteobacteria bacterium]
MPETVSDVLKGQFEFQLLLSRAMLGTLELDQLFYIITSGITHPKGLGFDRVVLFVADEKRRELKLVAAAGKPTEDYPAEHAPACGELDLPSLLDAYETCGQDGASRALAEHLAGFSMPLGVSAPPLNGDESEVPVQAVIARVVQERQAMLLDRVSAFYQPPPASGGQVLHFANIACAPLILRDEVIGVILADNPFSNSLPDEDKLQALSGLANLAALALDRANLHRKIQEMASQDGLTGLANRDHYQKRLEQEIARARRTGRTLALMLFDVDLFKQINDRHGHEKGDHVLKDLAVLLKSRVRSEDLVARYGGDEFTVLLTGGTSLKDAVQVADKLRQYIESQSLAGLPAGQVTVSAGVATTHGQRLDAKKLFADADAALYKAKENGRNRVEHAG